MGCKYTKTVNGSLKKKESCKKGSPLVKGEKPNLTNQQKALVLNTWKLLVENISRVGVITFMSLFETHPDVQEVFMPFRDLTREELSKSTDLRAHALRVMGFVQKIVARLDEPEKAEQLLHELGKKHIMYGAKPEYVDLIGPQFVYAVKPSLEDHWTNEIEEAWLQLFRFIAYCMKESMLECSRPVQQ